MADHFRCDKCNQDFQSQDQYDRHNKDQHQGQGGMGGGQQSQGRGEQEQRGGSEYRQ